MVARGEEILSAYQSGEPVVFRDEGKPVGNLLPKPKGPRKWDPENPNAIWEEVRRFRESLPKGGEPMVVRDIRELRES